MQLTQRDFAKRAYHMNPARGHYEERFLSPPSVIARSEATKQSLLLNPQFFSCHCKRSEVEDVPKACLWDRWCRNLFSSSLRASLRAWQSLFFHSTIPEGTYRKPAVGKVDAEILKLTETYLSIPNIAKFILTFLRMLEC